MLIDWTTAINDEPPPAPAAAAETCASPDNCPAAPEHSNAIGTDTVSGFLDPLW